MEIQNINLREEYHDDAHEMKAKWWMRWGILSVFILLGIVFLLARLVRYPDVINAPFRFTTNRPSITLPLERQSQIETLFVRDGDPVFTHEHLLVLKNNSRYADVITIRDALAGFQLDSTFLTSFFERFHAQNLQLGDLIENDWVTFSNDVWEYYRLTSLQAHQKQINNLKRELHKQQQLKLQYQNLISMDRREMALLKNQLHTDSTLFSKGVMSRQQYETNQRQFLQNTKSLQQNSLTLKRILLDMTRLENEIKTQQFAEQEKRLHLHLKIRESLGHLEASIKLWEKNYVITAPNEGTVAFIQDLRESRFFEGNILIITPRQKQYHASLTLPFAGAGKVQTGQKVILKLNDYPYREYGVLKGTVEDLSVVAGEKFYNAKVQLSDHQLSSFDKPILIKENMSGMCEIITRDRHFLGRVFEKLTYAFHH